jgi:hypothetical protein
MSNLAYSYQAQVGSVYLKRNYNDIAVFVEDVTCKNMWVALINKILGNKGHIDDVFPLETRSAVISAISVYDPNKLARPAIFIIDADLDLLAGSPPPAGPPLHRLQGYCIENLLLDETALVEVAFESHADATKSVLAQTLKLPQRLDRIARFLKPLFEVYAAAYMHGASIQTVGFSVVRLLHDERDPDSLSVDKLAARCRQVRSHLFSQFGYPAVKSTLATIRSISRGPGYSSRLVSGKDYLLPLIYMLLQRRCDFRDSKKSLCVRLAQWFRPDTCPALAAAVLSLIPTT